MNKREKILSLKNHQQVFDFVVDHLYTQGRRSLESGWPQDHPGDDVCLYRDGNGASCAVGCLILDEEYSEGLESLDTYGLVEIIPRLGPFTELLDALQTVHDRPTNWDDGGFKGYEELQDIAQIAGLTIPERELF